MSAARVTSADVLRHANLWLEEKTKRATINRELATLRAAHQLGLDTDTIVAMPHSRLLPENNARQGFAGMKQVVAICRRRSPDLAGGFVRLEPSTTKNSEGRVFPLIPELRALLERTQTITVGPSESKSGSSACRRAAAVCRLAR